MFNLTQNDISFFQEKLTKKKQKSSNYKEEIKLLKQENLKQLEKEWEGKEITRPKHLGGFLVGGLIGAFFHFRK
jgi:hypothetical protein